MVFGGMTMTQGFLSSVDSSTVGWDEMEARDEEIMRTKLATVNASMPSLSLLELTLRNSGETKLADFADWDVIVQYYDSGGGYYVKWLPYTEGTPGGNEWTVEGIYLDGETEVLETGILNAGEEVVIEAKLDPPVGVDTTNLVVTSTPNGIPASIAFSD